MSDLILDLQDLTDIHDALGMWSLKLELNAEGLKNVTRIREALYMLIVSGCNNVVCKQYDNNLPLKLDNTSALDLMMIIEAWQADHASKASPGYEDVDAATDERIETLYEQVKSIHEQLR